MVQETGALAAGWLELQYLACLCVYWMGYCIGLNWIVSNVFLGVPILVWLNIGIGFEWVARSLLGITTSFTASVELRKGITIDTYTLVICIELGNDIDFYVRY